MRAFFKKIAIFGLFLSFDLAADSDPAHRFDDLEGPVVRNLSYPKAGRFEISFLDIGGILNQTYVYSFAFHADVTFFFNETWGMALEAIHFENFDRANRLCLETLYNDPAKVLTGVCAAADTADQKQANLNIMSDPNNGANFGPVYPPMRTINDISGISLIYTPTYGKEILLASATVHFDLWFSAGVGMMYSSYYKEQVDDPSGNPYRVPNFRYQTTPDGTGVVGCTTKLGSTTYQVPGVCVDSSGHYLSWTGKAGRPQAIAEFLPAGNLGIGQKFHFLKNYHLSFELRGFMVQSKVSSFNVYVMGWGGLGMRF